MKKKKKKLSQLLNKKKLFVSNYHFCGMCVAARPGFMDFKGKAKWDAWDGRKGLAQDAAKEQYIAKVASLIESIGKK